MNTLTISFDHKTSATDLRIIAVSSSDVQQHELIEQDTARKGQLSQLLKEGLISAKKGNTSLVARANSRSPNVLLVGIGDKPLTLRHYRELLEAAANAAQATKHTQVECTLPTLDVTDVDSTQKLVHAALIFQNSLYRYDDASRGKAAKEDAPLLNTLALPKLDLSKEEAQQAANQGQATALGMALTRTLGNLPPNLLDPEGLAAHAKTLAKTHDLNCTILKRADMENLGMGSLLAVAQGSAAAPRLIALEYKGAKGKPIALVGKGVTFDSGGISLKPGAGMDEMKFDMCGAATVLGVMQAVAELKLPIHLVGVIPAVENMPAGNAARPGDVVTSMSGQTIEILNTDAEGRLILCDALTWTQREFKPAQIIDMATLTGACIIALGNNTSGLMGNNDNLQLALQKAGIMSYDRAWSLPLYDEYDEQLKSNFADMGNIGGREAGTITAGCFLKRFIENDTPWAHLDIAGTAWVSGTKKGASGRPVPLLVQYLVNQAQKEKAED
jgi:leucyl aminopeptidase